MTTNLQVTLDCADPHAMADFWAAALGGTVERHDDLIRRVLAEGHATDADVMTRDDALVWRDAASMVDPAGRLPRWYFQRVAEPKAGKNRMHVDVQVGPSDRLATVERLVGLGASELYVGQQGPYVWTTMADPEGNEFCVS